MPDLEGDVIGHVHGPAILGRPRLLARRPLFAQWPCESVDGPNHCPLDCAFGVPDCDLVAGMLVS